MATVFKTQELRDMTVSRCSSYMDEIAETICHGIDNTPVPAGHHFTIDKVLGRYNAVFYTVNDNTAECYLYIAGLKEEDKPIQFGGQCEFAEAESVNDAYAVAFVSAMHSLFDTDENKVIAERDRADEGPDVNKGRGKADYPLSLALTALGEEESSPALKKSDSTISIDYNEDQDTVDIIFRYTAPGHKPERFSLGCGASANVENGIFGIIEKAEDHVAQRLAKQ